jgi:hypothetical protein
MGEGEVGEENGLNHPARTTRETYDGHAEFGMIGIGLNRYAVGTRTTFSL